MVAERGRRLFSEDIRRDPIIGLNIGCMNYYRHTWEVTDNSARKKEAVENNYEKEKWYVLPLVSTLKLEVLMEK